MAVSLEYEQVLKETFVTRSRPVPANGLQDFMDMIFTATDLNLLDDVLRETEKERSGGSSFYTDIYNVTSCRIRELELREKMLTDCDCEAAGEPAYFF